MLNFKFEFCNYTHRYLLRDVTFRTIAKFTEKVEVELHKIDM